MRKAAAYLSIGSNIGDKALNLDEAVKRIGEIEGLTLIKCSSYYATSPVGYLEQDEFLNCCVKILTDVTPFRLLKEINRIEVEMGRVRLIHWGPRVIDIDIIFFGSLRLKRKELTIPHKEFRKRGFVLLPLLEFGELRGITRFVKKAEGRVYKR